MVMKETSVAVKLHPYLELLICSSHSLCQHRKCFIEAAVQLPKRYGHVGGINAGVDFAPDGFLVMGQLIGAF